MTELQGWLIVGAVWVSACGTACRAFTAWRSHRVEYARLALDFARVHVVDMTKVRLETDPPRVAVRES